MSAARKFLAGFLLAGGTAALLLRRPRRRVPWTAIRTQLLGAPRRQIMNLFGAPPAVSPAGKDYQKSRIWYYPVDAQSHQAMAVRFSGRGRVVGVDLIQAPDELGISG